LLAAPHEDPQRLVVKAGDHDQRIGLGNFGQATLNERDIDSRFPIEQQLQVLARALGDAFLEGYTFTGKHLFVALSLLVVEAGFGTGREDDSARWERLQEPK
jgi:hypothetical protein